MGRHRAQSEKDHPWLIAVELVIFLINDVLLKT